MELIVQLYHCFTFKHYFSEIVRFNLQNLTRPKALHREAAGAVARSLPIREN